MNIALQGETLKAKINNREKNIYIQSEKFALMDAILMHTHTKKKKHIQLYTRKDKKTHVEKKKKKSPTLTTCGFQFISFFFFLDNEKQNCLSLLLFL